MKRSFLLILSFIFSFTIYSQDEFPGVDYITPFTGSGVAFASRGYNTWVEYEDRKVSKERKKIERKIYRKNKINSNEVYRFEIVFHNMTEMRESEFEAYTTFQLEALNRDYMSRPPMTPQEYYYRVVDVPQFQFQLAREGIIQVGDYGRWDDFNKLKDKHERGSDPINPNKFINVWVIDIPNHIGSYAQAPQGPKEFDGIVIDIDFFGRSAEPYAQGKTLTRLVAEFFGLSPLFDKNNCGDDNILDTPVHHFPMRNCYGSDLHSSCDDRPTMTMNFMSLAPDQCKYMFTRDQVSRMYHMIINSNDRKSLFTKTTAE